MEADFLEEGWEKVSTANEGVIETIIFRKGDKERRITRRSHWIITEEFKILPGSAIREESE